MQAKGPYPRTDDYRELEAFWRRGVMIPVIESDIQDNAATVIVSSFHNHIDALSTDDQNPTELVTAEITTTGEGVTVLYSALAKYEVADYAVFSVWRDTTSLYLISFGYVDGWLPAVIKHIDTPPAGTYTYKIKAYAYATTFDVGYHRLTVFGMKK